MAEKPIIGTIPAGFLPGLVQDEVSAKKIINMFLLKYGYKERLKELEIDALAEKLTRDIIKGYTDVVERELLKGMRVEIGDALLLRPYQSRYDLHHSVTDVGENVDGKKNKIRIIPRKKFQDELNQKNFHGLEPRGR